MSEQPEAFDGRDESASREYDEPGEVTPGRPSVGARIGRWLREHKLVPIAVFVAAALIFLWARTGDHKERVDVVRVVAGDQFVAELAGEQITVQLANVRTPGPDTCFGTHALSALQTIIRPGERIEVLFDSSLTAQEGRQRSALVTIKDRPLNAALASTGLARVVREGKNLAFDDASAASQGAQQAQVGLFDPNHVCAGKDPEFDPAR